MSEPTKPRWYNLTPGKLVLGLILLVLCFLLADPTSGWLVLAGIAVVILGVLIGSVWLAISLVLKRRFQFSVLSLLGLAFCLAILGSWFSWKTGRARRQTETVEWLEELGGLVTYVMNTDITPVWLPHLQEFPKLKEMHIILDDTGYAHRDTVRAIEKRIEEALPDIEEALPHCAVDAEVLYEGDTVRLDTGVEFIPSRFLPTNDD
jgi:hypothetical protein